jgi:hypothetical protein
MRKELQCALFFCLIAVACEKDIPEPAPGITPPKISDDSVASFVIVANEGNFTWGNASIDKYYLKSATLERGVYRSANGKALGDIAQSLMMVDSFLFVVVNNSGRILKLKLPELKELARRDGLNSPRYLLPLNDGTALLSDLGSNALLKISLSNLSTLASYSVDGWIEQMAYCSGKVFACDVRNNKVLVIQPADGKLLSTVDVGGQPQWICSDSVSRVWVLCDGGLPGPEKKAPTLYEISAIENTAVKVHTLGDKDDVVRMLELDILKNRLYYIMKDVYSLGINDGRRTRFISAADRNFYGLKLRKNGELFITDASSFVEKGKLLHYSGSGQFIDEVEMGIIPQAMVCVE